MDRWIDRWMNDRWIDGWMQSVLIDGFQCMCPSHGGSHTHTPE
jgi:hypothetical protein